MFKLKNIVRNNILNLKPYSSARDEFSGDSSIFLDANENPFGKLNRYPDPYQKKLKKILGTIKSINDENIFIGNGSDEIIDLVYRVFCTPKKNKAITFSPSYGMYDVSAEINEVELIKIPLNNSFQIDLHILKKYLENKNIKVIFICSPNNPTGNNINNIEWILENFNGIVVVDEAYIDFSFVDSFITKITKYPNLIVLQTLSKAWGLAAARVGMGFASKEIISILNKVKPPYNISELNQHAAIDALENYDSFKKTKAIIIEQKNWLVKNLSTLKFVKKIFPSDANFILVETTNAIKIYNYLVENKIITRNRHMVVNNCIRITIGTKKENIQLFDVLKKLQNEENIIY
jgi:histidinol-phosphate aminotransferase